MLCTLHKSVCSNYNLSNVTSLKTELPPVFLSQSLLTASIFVVGLFCFFFHFFAFCTTSCSCYQLSLLSPSSQERPKSALERLYSGDSVQQQRGKMSADEQLERMKRHQKALVRQRKRTLSQGDRHASPSSRTSSSSSRPLSADLGSVCY